MTNRDVVGNFINMRVASANNLFSTGDRLISYETCIAQWVSGKMIINETKYSITTSHHQGILKRMYPDCEGNIGYVNRINQGVLWLVPNQIM